MSVAGIEDILPRYQEIANGTKTDFTVSFELIENQFVSVYLGTEKQSSGYSIDLTNKKIVFDSAPDSGKLVTIVRAVPASWESNLHGALNSEGINQLFTHIMASIQTVKEEVSRAVKSNIYDNVDGGQLSEFFLKQLVDAQDILDRAESNLALLNSASQTALSDLESARTSALGDINQSYQNSLNDITTTGSQAVSSIASAKDSAITDMNTILTSVEESEVNAAASASAAKASADKAKETADSIVNNSADKDLSNLSTTGQAKFDAKQNTITGGATTITSANLTAGRALVSDGSGKVSVSAVTSTELGYLDGVTSNVQTQLNAKQTTDNLSQTLDNSTTKYPSNNAVKTQLDLKANNSDVLHKTGDETKSGILTVQQLIANEGNGVVIKGADYNYTLRSTGPMPNSNGCALIKDNDINYVAFKATDKNFLIGSKNIPAETGYMPSDTSSTTSQRIVPAGWINSRITSVMNSQIRVVSRGYQWIKFDDGLLIQWGHLNAAERDNTVISFNTPFVDKDSICIYYGALRNATVNQNTTYSTQDWSTVNFTVRNITEAAGQGSTQARWLAIGH